MKKESLDRYCSHCGAKMVMTTKPKPTQYDSKTGKKLEDAFYHYWKCPNSMNILVDTFTGHDSYNDEPDTGGY